MTRINSANFFTITLCFNLKQHPIEQMDLINARILADPSMQQFYSRL